MASIDHRRYRQEQHTRQRSPTSESLHVACGSRDRISNVGVSVAKPKRPLAQDSMQVGHRQCTRKGAWRGDLMEGPFVLLIHQARSHLTSLHN